MLAHELKQYIVDNNLLIPLLEKLKFHHIKEKNISNEKWILCAWEDGDNEGAIQVKPETLFVRTYTHTSLKGDIYSLVGYLYKTDFINSLRKVHELLDISYTKTYRTGESKKEDILNPLKKYRKASIIGQSNKTYPLSILNKYKQINWIEWVKQGISNKVAKEFLVCYDTEQERMLLPYRSLNPEDKAIIGITGRTLLSHETCKEFGIPKYICVLPFSKTQTLYGYVENYNHILSKGEVVIGESEKMVLQRASLLDRAILGVGGHTLSKKQVQLLIGLNVDVIIGFDKDVTEEQLWQECEKFYGIRNIFYIYDKTNLLGEKDAPVDKGDDIYQILYKSRIKYDQTIHDKYLKIQDKIKPNSNENYFTGEEILKGEI